MRVAIILHGNMRTFLMPLREDRSLRLCDLFVSNIAKPNAADLFIVTDTNDFYHDGVHYFDETQRGQVKNTSSTMFHDVVGFMGTDEARALLAMEINGILGERIKAIEIQGVIDVSADPKFVLLSNSAGSVPERIPYRVKGSVPARIVSQYLKIKLAHELLQKHERDNCVHYDLIFRGRFDNMYGRRPIDISSFDYEASDVFVPGWGGPIIFDWCAFGTRRAMDLALSLYDHLGFTLSNRLYRCECMACGSLSCGEMIKCDCGGKMEYDEMSLSSEYHLYRLFKDNGIRYALSGCPMSPYRYRA